MHDFRYKNNDLYCENVRVAQLAERFGTPLYVYSYRTLIGHFAKLRTAFKKVRPLICYSVKANSNLAILKALVKQGAGLDIVSGGELFRAIKTGCPAQRIVYASVGKTDDEIKEALRLGILFFNVESIPELENINRIAAGLGKTVNIAMRINPDVESKTHRFITTGRLTNKFGIDFETALQIFRQRRRFANLKICGLHIHIGSQIIQSGPFVAAIGKVVRFIEGLKSEGIVLEYFNIGGGLGIVYDDERPQTARIFAANVLPLLKRAALKIILEPGRFIVGNAGVLVAKVLYIKKTARKKFIIVDAGMNDLIRPALYDAYHKIIPLCVPASQRPSVLEKADIVGPICESADFFAKARRMSDVNEGDCLAIMGAGAYGFSMASNYNSRPRPAEIMVIKDKFYVIRRRESYKDLVCGENIPGCLR